MRSVLSAYEALLAAGEHAKAHTGDKERPVGAAIAVFDPAYQIVYGTNVYPEQAEVTEDKSNIRHAEEDVILAARAAGLVLERAIMYVTKAPCLDCAKLIVETKVDVVIMASPDPTSRWYDSQLEGVKYLRDNKIAVNRITEVGDIIRDVEQFKSEQSSAR